MAINIQLGNDSVPKTSTKTSTNGINKKTASKSTASNQTL
jgi:hypothetical protein